MSYSLEFRLEGLPKMSNANLRGGWKAKAGNARTWKRKVWRCAWHLKPPIPLKAARLTLIRCSASEPDTDGLISGFKHIVDGLVEAGILENDRPSNIGIPDYRWQKAAPGLGHVIVKVTETTKEMR